MPICIAWCSGGLEAVEIQNIHGVRKCSGKWIVIWEDLGGYKNNTSHNPFSFHVKISVNGVSMVCSLHMVQNNGLDEDNIVLLVLSDLSTSPPVLIGYY